MLTLARFRRRHVNRPKRGPGFFTSSKRTIFPFINSYRSPRRRLPNFDMFYTSCFGPFTFAISLSSISFSLANFIASDPSDHSPCIPCRYSSLCPTFGVGGLDCVSFHNFDHGERGGNMRNAKNSREPKGTEEENRAECGNERRNFLQSPKRNRG